MKDCAVIFHNTGQWDGDTVQCPLTLTHRLGRHRALEFDHHDETPNHKWPRGARMENVDATNALR
jgi:hypothetical protein